MLKLSQFGASYKTPEVVYLASTNQLKRLLLTFRTRYSCATTSFAWHNALLYVANTCLPLHPYQTTSASASGKHVQGVITARTGSGPAVEDPHRRAWFLACIDGYRALAPQFHLVHGIVQGLLSMSMQAGLLSTTEAKALMDGVRADTQHLSQYYHNSGGRPDDAPHTADDEVDSVADGTIHDVDTRLEAWRGGETFVVDLNMAAVDPSAALLRVLTQSFDEMAMLEEFTTISET